MPRSLARATALRRQREPAPWLPWLALLAALIAGIVAARAQAPTAPLLPPGAGGSGQAVPTAISPRSEHPDVPGNAAARAGEAPRAAPDPGIVAPPPGIGSTLPVAPVPGGTVPK